MVLKTLIEHHNQLLPAEVELSLLPGLPQIHFLGLPDRVIKESFFRIKSAVRWAGYQFPANQQLIVNIRPNSLKKSSAGLELAVALGLLHLTEQRPLACDVLQSIIYGELDLSGEVRCPQNISQFRNENKELVLSGLCLGEIKTSLLLTHLKEDIQHVSFKPITSLEHLRPQWGLLQKYSKLEAELIFLMATTKKHTLLAGQAGAGKSFLSKAYLSFLNVDLNIEDFKPEPRWPVRVAPHHSVTPAAFLGGGAQLYEGEIEKVENGVLVLDELLEFSPQILESLREPMTGEVLRLARAGSVREIQPHFQVLATSNLCVCGQWTPNTSKNLSCRYSAQKCKAVLQKLSGPLLDRFTLIFFAQNNSEPRTISGEALLERLNQFHQLQKKLSEWPASSYPSLAVELEPVFQTLYGASSMRRQKALLDISAIYALERGASSIELTDLTRAEAWCLTPFQRLAHGMHH